MVANIIYSDRLNATWVKCHLVAFYPGGNYQGNLKYNFLVSYFQEGTENRQLSQLLNWLDSVKIVTKYAAFFWQLFK